MAGAKLARLDTDGLDLPLTVGGGRARTLLHPDMGAQERELTYVELPEGASTDEMRHPDREAVYYVISGSGQVEDPTTGETQAIRSGLFVYLDPGQPYRFVGPAVLVGGPCGKERESR